MRWLPGLAALGITPIDSRVLVSGLPRVWAARQPVPPRGS